LAWAARPAGANETAASATRPSSLFETQGEIVLFSGYFDEIKVAQLAAKCFCQKMFALLWMQRKGGKVL
jgi:hypothetical protein